MATKKDLLNEIDRLNNKYCKKSSNCFVLSQAYGGYDICLTGKKNKNGLYKKNSLGSGVVSICDGHDTATNTLRDLYKSESRGWLPSTVNYYNKRK